MGRSRVTGKFIGSPDAACVTLYVNRCAPDALVCTGDGIVTKEFK